jgi:hypothetical protein
VNGDSPALGELTPREYALLTPEALGGLKQYRDFCRTTGLTPTPNGYGLLFCEQSDGSHVTVATEDLEYWHLLRNAADTPDLLGGVAIPPGKFRWRRPGWPDEWRWP